MVYSKTLGETNPSIPTKPLRAGEAHNMADLMPPTLSSALPQDPMTRRNKGKEKEIGSESLRYQQSALMASDIQYNHQETLNYTATNSGYRFGALRPTPTEQAPGIQCE
jgi:hypothetical protein